MAKYQNLINSISSVIRTNGNNEITGQILQDVLKSIVNVVGANPTYGGVAHPADNPGTPEGGVVYIASDEGTYVNFGGLTLEDNELAVLVWDGTSWSKESVTYIEDLGDIEEAKQEALAAIAEAIQGLNIYYTIETDKGTVKDVQLKDGQGNRLMPITSNDNDVKENFNDLGHRHGLDFSNYTLENKYRYLNVIVYAYATLKPTAAETKVEIYALAKNRNSDGNLRIWFHLVDNNLNIQTTLNLSDINLENGYYIGISQNSKVKINYLLNVDALNDGEAIIFGGTEGKRVCVDIVGLNDIRRKWFTIPPENYAIQQQFRNLDFTSYTYDVTPYIKTILFCGIKWNVDKPDWAYDKPRLYGLAWNHNNNGRIDIAVLLGKNGSNYESIWIRKNITDYNDTFPTYEVAISNSYWCKLYVAYNPLEIKIAGTTIVYSDSDNIVKVGELEEDDPRIVQYETFNKFEELNERVSSIEGNPNFWNGKKLVWYGTSIPAGSDSALGQEGIGITYPEIAASYIGASCSNEAVGSGRASYLPLTRNETFQHLARCQGGTIASKLELLKSIYIIDDDNRTVVMGTNTYGITDLPYSSAPTYEQAVALRTEIISYSYQIKLISRYLDSTNQYISNVLNSQEVKDLLIYSGSSYELLYRDSMAYKYTPDLFVFDHGTNDNAYLGSDVNSRDTTTFYGAMNMMYDWIQFYSPKSIVCQVTDYGTSRYGNDSVIQHQQAWAEYWQIPLLRTCDVVPWNGALVTLQGYWDGGNGQSGRWHNDGFYFNESGNTWETNNGIILRKYTASTPASTVISDFNIRTIEGRQVYTVQQKYKYFKDGLHPHTDSSGDALKFYAKHLSKMLIGIAPNSD